MAPSEQPAFVCGPTPLVEAVANKPGRARSSAGIRSRPTVRPNRRVSLALHNIYEGATMKKRATRKPSADAQRVDEMPRREF